MDGLPLSRGLGFRSGLLGGPADGGGSSPLVPHFIEKHVFISTTVVPSDLPPTAPRMGV